MFTDHVTHCTNKTLYSRNCTYQSTLMSGFLQLTHSRHTGQKHRALYKSNFLLCRSYTVIWLSASVRFLSNQTYSPFVLSFCGKIVFPIRAFIRVTCLQGTDDRAVFQHFHFQFHVTYLWVLNLIEKLKYTISLIDWTQSSTETKKLAVLNER